ncbi:MAG: hypothetical protein H6546_02750 [Chitinophagales bacterium]|nr:hypothetical protein [Chitinophagales bacterium]
MEEEKMQVYIACLQGQQLHGLIENQELLEAVKATSHLHRSGDAFRYPRLGPIVVGFIRDKSDSVLDAGRIDVLCEEIAYSVVKAGYTDFELSSIYPLHVTYQRRLESGILKAIHHTKIMIQ